MLEKLLSSHSEEAKTRLHYRQSPEEVADDFLKRRIISKDRYEMILSEMKTLSAEYERIRMTKSNGPKNI